MLKIKESLVYILALFPIFDFRLVNISILFYVLGSLIKCSKKGSAIKRLNKRFVCGMLLLSLPFILNVISLLWTQNFRSGVTFVERTLPFLIFPLVTLFCNPFKSKEAINKFIRIYIFSNVILVIVVLVYMIIGRLYYPNLVVYNGNLGKCFRETVEAIPIVGEHPIYLSLLIGSALLFLFYVRFKQYWVNVAIGCLFLIVLGLSGSRGPTAALLISIFILIILKKISATTKIVALSAFFVVATIGLLISPIKSRMMEFVNTKHIYPQGDYYNSFNIRMGIYKCSLEVGEHVPWYGLGPGDVQDNLDLCYHENYNTNAYKEGIFNTHNQYLFYWLSFGVGGLIFMLVTYVFFYREAKYSNNKVYIVFLAYMCFCFLFENILSRNTGIMLFAIFNTIFQVKNDLLKESKLIV